MKVTDLILDFDGTCTQIPVIYQNFWKKYLEELNKPLPEKLQITDDLWQRAVAQVTQQSPSLGWSISTTPSAPAAADPYILAGEAAKYIFKNHLPSGLSPSADAFKNASTTNPAPWRPEALEVFRFLLSKGVHLHFVSNSDTQMIRQRTQDLFGGELLSNLAIDFNGNASKYNINEPDWKDKAGWPDELKQLYAKVPAAQSVAEMDRPVYLRRGNFMNIIAAIFKTEPGRIATTVFCGDIWELDCALPAALGGLIHLVRRERPFPTDDYEARLALADSARGQVSDDLTGLRSWFLNFPNS